MIYVQTAIDSFLLFTWWSLVLLDSTKPGRTGVLLVAAVVVITNAVLNESTTKRRLFEGYTIVVVYDGHSNSKRIWRMEGITSFPSWTASKGAVPTQQFCLAPTYISTRFLMHCSFRLAQFSLIRYALADVSYVNSFFWSSLVWTVKMRC